MAKKASNERTDPHANKSLAIRLTLERMPAAKASEIADAVRTNYGHKISTTLVYLVKSKVNVKKADRKTGKAGVVANGKAKPIGGAAEWVDAIRLARKLLAATGSVENAVAILKAVQ